MPTLTISQLAASAQVGVETVRFYQRRKLLRAPDATEKARGIRHYDRRDVDRLQFIRSAKLAGFTLAEIGELLTLDAGSDRARARVMAAERIADIDRQIAALTRARASLARLANECARDEAGPCPIIASFQQG
ncbi:MAG: MerR family DNA-binding protein [Sphingomonadales bacterium]|nr:MerR family DNA-binding protein [Sphingomonadales bacterium]